MVNDPEVSGIVGKEILDGRLNPAFWALALAESDGSHEHAITCYARLRIASLAGGTYGRKLKEEALEERRRAGFRENPTKYTARPVRTEFATPTRLKRTIHGNRRRHRLSWFWLLTCALGLSGALAAASRHYLSSFPDSIGDVILFACLSIGPLLAVSLTTLHICAPRSRPIISHLMPVTASGAACASLLFGLLVIKAQIEGPRHMSSSSRQPAQILPPTAEASNLNSIAATRDSDQSP